MDVRRLVLGGALVALGAVIGVVGLVWALRGFVVVDTSVPTDGVPHRVAIGTGEHVVWVDSSVSDPDCEVEAGGTPLRLRPVAGTSTRSLGSAGPWVARWWFDSPQEVVEVTCDGVSTSDREAVEIGPRVRPLTLVGQLLGVVALAGLLVLAGGLVLLVTVLRALAAQSRPETT